MRGKLCAACRWVADETRFRLRPTHVVHPMTHKPGVRDTYGRALCPTCYTVWRFNCDNSVEIVR